MRLKEIKPGMVIHCKTKEELEEISKYAEFKVDVEHIWNYGNDGIRRDCIYINDDGRFGGFDTYRYFAIRGNKITEFSDLILPELTAEEAIKLHAEVCKHSFIECPLYEVEGYENCDDFCFKNPERAVEILAQWKTDHEKREPEIETVDICRIIEIQPDGRKRCVHEEDIDPGLPFDSEKEIVKILKRYCMEHDGEFIAVHEVVSRVKR